MDNNNLLEIKKPFIFRKKLNNNTKIVLFNNTQNTLAPIRYFPPANQEWFNSIYTYNSVYAKNITIADKSLSSIIKSYFNLFFSKKFLDDKSIPIKFKRSFINKIFVSKAELKHTTNKVIITLYVYNEEMRILKSRLRLIEGMLFSSFISNSNEVNEKKILSLKEKLDILKKEENLSLNNFKEVIRKNLVEEIKLEKKSLDNITNLIIKNEKLLEIENLEKSLINLLAITPNCHNYSTITNIYDKYINKTFLEKEIIIIAYYKLLLNLNKFKFEDKLLYKLKPLIGKIYNKEIDFNIINLKTIYLNSDIFTQVIALKLRDRRNSLLNVMSQFLTMVNLPKTNVLREQYAYIDVKNLWINKVKGLTSKFLDVKTNGDSLNKIITGLFNYLNKTEVTKEYDNNKSIINHVLNDLKHKNIAGVRLEAKGRLTRRSTAARSIFKIRWKGSLKNIYSSYRGLSSVILRGHIKSNVEYSIINSKTRNGAFGVKGWISGK